MRHHRTAVFSGAVALASFIGVGAGAAANAASAYGPTTPSSTTTTVMQSGRLQHIAEAATLHTVTTDVHGKTESILVDAKGLPLYYHQGDTAKKSRVSGELARLWPALVSAHPTSTTGAPGKLTALDAANGHQVAYNGRFLYTFIADLPGHVTGQGVSDFFVATPHLKSIRSSTATAPVVTAGGSYGY